MEDEAIIDLYERRQENAILETSKKYGSYCKGIAMNIVANYEDAEECVNDTYLHTWKAIPPEKPRLFSAYLGKITRNLAINRYRHNHAKKRGEGKIDRLLDELEECIPSTENIEKTYEEQIVVEHINKFLYNLDKEMRIVFVRRYWYGDSIENIVEKYQMSESKVKSMLFRTRRKLKSYLEKEEVL